MQRDMEKLKRNDYRKYAFNYPIGPDMRGEYTHHYDDRRYYALDEIFTHGADVKSKYFAFTDTADDLKELEGIDVMSTLRDVFGYD